MDAIKILENDHEAAKLAMEKINKTSGPPKKALFEAFVRELHDHNRIEETIFFSSVKLGPATLGFSEKVAIAHRVVEGAASHLAKLDMGDRRWTIIFQAMEEKLLGHMHEEDTVIFEKIRQLTSDFDLREIGKRMLAERGNQLKATEVQG
jgi:hemerythrin superfamily protein